MRNNLLFGDAIINNVSKITTGGARADFIFWWQIGSCIFDIWHHQKMRHKLFSGNRIMNYKSMITTDAARAKIRLFFCIFCWFWRKLLSHASKLAHYPYFFCNCTIIFFLLNKWKYSTMSHREILIGRNLNQSESTIRIDLSWTNQITGRNSCRIFIWLL
jgi:hypothetical protein